MVYITSRPLAEGFARGWGNTAIEQMGQIRGRGTSPGRKKVARGGYIERVIASDRLPPRHYLSGMRDEYQV